MSETTPASEPARNRYEFQTTLWIRPNSDGIHCGECGKHREDGGWCYLYAQNLTGAGWRTYVPSAGGAVSGEATDDGQVWHEPERCRACLDDAKRHFVAESVGD